MKKLLTMFLLATTMIIPSIIVAQEYPSPSPSPVYGTLLPVFGSFTNKNNAHTEVGSCQTNGTNSCSVNFQNPFVNINDVGCLSSVPYPTFTLNGITMTTPSVGIEQLSFLCWGD